MADENRVSMRPRVWLVLAGIGAGGMAIALLPQAEAALIGQCSVNLQGECRYERDDEPVLLGNCAINAGAYCGPEPPPPGD